MSNFMCMKQNENGAKIASTAVVEVIRDFLLTWYSVAKLYKNLARAYSELHDVVNKYGVDLEEVEYITKSLDQCMMVTELLEKIEKEEAGL